MSDSRYRADDTRDDDSAAVVVAAAAPEDDEDAWCEEAVVLGVNASALRSTPRTILEPDG